MHTKLNGRIEAAADGTWTRPTGDGLKETVKAAVLAAVIAVPFLGIGGWVIGSQRAEAIATRAAFFERMKSHERQIAGPAGPVVGVDEAVHGREVFTATCAVCHGAAGQGMDGLGKDLTQSWFVASLDDAALARFIATGRAVADPLNTTKVAMPAKGGRDELTEADLKNVVAYVRGLQDPRRMPALPAFVAPAIAAATDDEKKAALAAAGGDAELAEYIAHGTKIFASTCAACHGKDAKGLPNLGKNLTTSEFAKKLDDDALLAFLKRGRDPGDPLNTTKVGMPPRGGNPALSDDDLLDVISYVRSLQKQTGATP